MSINKTDAVVLTSLALLATAFVVSGYGVGRANGQDERPLQVVESVDLKRYAGRWYEIARLPNRFEKDCAGDITADYAHRPDGKIDVVNRCRKTNGTPEVVKGVARVKDTATNAKLEVRFAPGFLSFLPQVWGDYQIIGLATDYSYVVVGDPPRKYLWVLARTPQLDTATYKRAIESAKVQGFDVSRLIKTMQRPADRAQPDIHFESHE